MKQPLLGQKRTQDTVKQETIHYHFIVKKIHIDPTKGNAKLGQVVSLNEIQVYPILIY